MITDTIEFERVVREHMRQNINRGKARDISVDTNLPEHLCKDITDRVFKEEMERFAKNLLNLK